MAKVLIIGAGGVGTVVAHKVAQVPEAFTNITLASRTKSKCDHIAETVGGNRITTAQVDADDVRQLVELFTSVKPAMVINVALPYQDLTIMDACLETGVHYLDTANYEPPNIAQFEYQWQWAYHDRFKEAGLTAILGCGFDQGSSPPTPPNIISTRFITLILWIVMQATTGDRLPPISIRKSTFAR